MRPYDGPLVLHWPMSSLEFTLNGRPVRLDAFASDATVLEYLRGAGLIGTKEGCGDGDCGACTVALASAGPHGEPRYQAVNSCLMPLGALAGREIVSVEGLAEGEALHPVQRAMVEAGGSQCGYCTPGFVMSLFAAYYGGERSDQAIEGNLCRCTGYLPIRRALQSLGEPAPDDRFLARLRSGHQKAEGESQQVGERFYLPERLEEVFALLERHPEARLIAGGTDLGLELSHKRLEDPVLIGLERVRELHGLEVSDEAVVIGAGVTLSRLEHELAGVFPALDEMLRWFAARQVRNRATVGGNLGTASPIGDLAPVLLALDAVVALASRQGRREVPIAGFFTGYRQTVRRPDEVILSVTLPRPKAGALGFAYKVGKRGADDISIVAAAFTVHLAEGRVAAARLAYGGVAATPVRAEAVEAWLASRPWSEATVLAALPKLREAFAPLDDLRGSARYRRELAANLFHKFYVQTQEGVLA